MRSPHSRFVMFAIEVHTLTDPDALGQWHTLEPRFETALEATQAAYNAGAHTFHPEAWRVVPVHCPEMIDAIDEPMSGVFSSIPPQAEQATG